MKKIILAVLIVFLMVGVILTSCKNDVNPVGEELVYVSFGEDSSRALIATLEDFDADDYWWSYEAQKNDGSGLISGQTAWDTTGEGAIPVQSGKGLNSVTNNVSAPTKVPGFSKGYWNFRLFAYIDSDRTQLALAYEGEADGVLIDSTNHMVNVVVSPVGVADGYLQIGEITFNPASASSSAASVVSTDTVYKLQGETWVDTGATPDSTGKYTLPAGQYKFSRVYSYEDIPVANGSVIVTVYSNLTTTISGSLSELTTFATFGADQNPDIITTTIGTESITMGTDTESVAFKSSSQTETKVTASMPTEAAKSLISELEKEMGAKTSTAESTTSDLTLNLSVNTTEATETTITYEIGMEATLVYQKLGPSTETTTTTTTVEALDDFVTVLIEIQRGLSEIKVMHNTTYMTECASLEELLAKTTSDEGANAGFFFYQDPYNDPYDNPDLGPDTKTAMLYIRTYRFSPFKLSYKLPSYVAAIGSVRYETLNEAIDAAGKGDTIILLANIVDAETFVVGNEKDITIDLNGKTIETKLKSEGRHFYAFDNYGTLTLKDDSTGGKIKARGIENLGGVLTIESGTYYSIDKNGGAAVWNENYGDHVAELIINGGSFIVEHVGSSSDSYGPGGINSRTGTKLTINAAIINSSNLRTYALIANGTTVINGTADTVVVNGGHGALAVDTGSITVNGGSFSATEYYGCWITNDDYDTKAVINGGSFTGKYGLYSSVDDGGQDVSDIAILVNGGTFTGTTGGAVINNKGTEHDFALVLKGGTYNTDPSEYVADGYYAHDNGNETWTVIPVPKGSKVRNGNKFYANLSEALADDCPAGSTLVLYDNITDSVSIKISNLTIDLNGNKLTAPDNSNAIKVSECENVTIKNGSVESEEHVFVIGEHHFAIVKWKNDGSGSMPGYHPLAPAKDVVLENITAVATGSKSMFYFTNIEDDLVRADKSNPTDNNLYGKYIYNGGYETEDLYTPTQQYSVVFIECSDKDKVSIIGGSYTASAMFGHMCKYTEMGDYSGEVYSEVVNPVSGVFSTDEIGKFLGEGKFLVGSNNDSFTIQDSAPTSYFGRVNNNYYCYEGGADSAIEYASFGDVVFISENSTTPKTFEQGDELTVVYEMEGISYSGAQTNDKYFTIKSREAEGYAKGVVIYLVFDPAAAVYTSSNRNNLVGEYAILDEAFKVAGNNGYYVVLLKDYECEDENKYYYNDAPVKTGVYIRGSMTFDLNGHTFTYTGKNYAITQSRQSGDVFVIDSVGGGAVIATKGGCFYNNNSKSERTTIRGVKFVAKKIVFGLYNLTSANFKIESGEYISEDSNVFSMIYKGSGPLVINGGVFKSLAGKAIISWGMAPTTCTINGGTFNADPTTFNTTKVTINNTVTDNKDGTWTVGSKL